MTLLNKVYGKLTIKREDRVISEAKELLLQRLKKQGVSFLNPDSVKNYLQIHFTGLDREVFVAIFLDSKHRLIEYRQLFVGTINECAIYPRVVIKEALTLNSHAVIFAHNHPSGSSEPSDADIRMTKRLKEALALLDIGVLDHFIVGDDIVSFSEKNLL